MFDLFSCVLINLSVYYYHVPFLITFKLINFCYCSNSWQRHWRWPNGIFLW